MFSHTIHNPNNFEINKECDVIPFGHRCSSALACNYANIRKCSLPFDWTIPSLPNKIQKVLENDFINFIPDVHNGIFHNVYDFTLAHFNDNRDTGIDEYKRRIDRFKNIINQPTKLYFVYINEDYLYDNKYRGEEFNNRIFNEMLELENYIREKYINIDYNIIYFNFMKHNIPTNSNIINIIMNTTTLFDNEYTSPFELFRNYCGKVLSELFNTELTLGYTHYTFHN